MTHDRKVSGAPIAEKWNVSGVGARELLLSEAGIRFRPPRNWTFEMLSQFRSKANMSWEELGQEDREKLSFILRFDRPKRMRMARTKIQEVISAFLGVSYSQTRDGYSFRVQTIDFSDLTRTSNVFIMFDFNKMINYMLKHKRSREEFFTLWKQIKATADGFGFIASTGGNVWPMPPEWRI